VPKKERVRKTSTVKNAICKSIRLNLAFAYSSEQYYTLVTSKSKLDNMFAIGHIALGYLTGKTAASSLKVKLNLTLVLVLSILPDIDLILTRVAPDFFWHRSMTHSIIVYTIIMTPFFVKYRKKAVPYYIVLLAHTLIGDYLTGGTELLWPLTSNIYGIQTLPQTGLVMLSTEATLFAISFVLMIYTEDLQTLFTSRKYHLASLIPFVAILQPAIAQGLTLNRQNLTTLLLIIPSIVWLIIMFYSIVRFNHRHQQQPPKQSQF